MPKKTNTIAQGIAAGLKEAIAHAQGQSKKTRVTSYTFADAKSIRENLGLSQRAFSSSYGIPLDTLQNWEQRRTNPDRTASAYLWAIKDLPEQISNVHMRNRKTTGSGARV